MAQKMMALGLDIDESAMPVDPASSSAPAAAAADDDMPPLESASNTMCVARRRLAEIAQTRLLSTTVRRRRLTRAGRRSTEVLTDPKSSRAALSTLATSRAFIAAVTIVLHRRLEPAILLLGSTCPRLVERSCRGSSATPTWATRALDRLRLIRRVSRQSQTLSLIARASRIASLVERTSSVDDDSRLSRPGCLLLAADIVGIAQCFSRRA